MSSETDDKRAPVQGFSGGIPWSMHLRAYDAYCKKWSPQPALIDLEGRNCRGGFATKELDEFIPGWREEVSEIYQLRQALQSAHAQGVMEGMERAAKAARSAIDHHRPDASFDDSQAGTAERNALLTNIVDEVEAAIRSQSQKE